MGNQSALHLKHAMVCDCACAVYIFIANWYPYTIGALTACACEMQLKVDFFIEYVFVILEASKFPRVVKYT